MTWTKVSMTDQSRKLKWITLKKTSNLQRNRSFKYKIPLLLVFPATSKLQKRCKRTITLYCRSLTENCKMLTEAKRTRIWKLIQVSSSLDQFHLSQKLILLPKLSGSTTALHLNKTGTWTDLINRNRSKMQFMPSICMKLQHLLEFMKWRSSRSRKRLSGNKPKG